MTGRHPMRNGITHTIFERERMALDAVTLPEVLRDAGYATGIFGKWHLGDEDPYQPNQRGFDEVFIHGAGGIGQAYEGACADVPDNKYFDPVIRHNGSFVQTDGYCTDIFFDAAAGWIRSASNDDKPFFAYLATNAPHEPFIAPASNTERFAKLGMEPNAAGFYGMVENIDENLGRMMDRLEAWGLLESTVVIFMSDNGTVYNGAGQEGTAVGQTADDKPLLAFNGGMKGYKGSVTEGGVRVPFFVHWPGHVAENREIDSVAAHIDVLPTLAALAGAEEPAGQVEGRSLLPLMGHEEAEATDRFLYTHAGRWKSGDEPNDYQWNNFSVRSERFRLVSNKALFDLSVDPGETENVIAAHPEVVAEMRSAYDAWWKATRPLMVNEKVKLSPTKPFHTEFYRQRDSVGIPRWERPTF